jgi:hypothetical protein
MLIKRLDILLVLLLGLIIALCSVLDLHILTGALISVTYFVGFGRGLSATDVIPNQSNRINKKFL